ncbi:hypothetical protein WJX77_003535 [Trebouxia sp. C0004]
MCEHRGLVFVHSHDPQQKLGEVFYDRDPSWQHELVPGVLSDVLAGDLRELAGIDTSELLSSGPSPRVALETRNKECDYAWVASDLASMDSVPSVILEVAVFNEDETELEAEGSEGMDLLQVQAAILVKVYHEENPIDDCPKISVGVWTRHHGQKVFTGYKECGGGGQAVSNVVFQHLSYACLAVCFFMEPRQMFHHMSWQQLSSWTCGISVAVSETSTRQHVRSLKLPQHFQHHLHKAGWNLSLTESSREGALAEGCGGQHFATIAFLC